MKNGGSYTVRPARGRLAAVAALLLASWGTAQNGPELPGAGPSVPAPAPAGQTQAYRLTFLNAPLEIILDDYARKTSRTLLMDPKVPKATVTLRSQGDLSLKEYLQAVETVLSMNGVATLKVGDKFVKVIPIAEARREEMTINEQQVRVVTGDGGKPATNALGKIVEEVIPLDEGEGLVSQMIPLKHITIEDARKAIDPLRHNYGQIHVFDTINSLLITDTGANINRIVQVLKYIDQPLETREEPHIITIRFTKATEIKKKLEEIIAEYQKDQEKQGVPRQKPSGSPGIVAAPSIAAPPGVIRARPLVPQLSIQPEISEEVIAKAERGIITGSAKIVADDRTNILIIITRPENMKFFDKIIKVLDVETSPDVIVKVFRLEFALAEEIEKLLNELIGATTRKEETAAPAPGTVKPGTAPESRSTALREIQQRVAEAAPVAAPAAPAAPRGEGKSKVGELSKENVKILADKRTNALIIMASKSDVATLQEIIRDMDMMLSQVLVEAVVLEVSLDNNIETGFDWVQKSMIAYRQGADGKRTPVMGFAGSGGGGDLPPAKSLSFTDPGNFPATEGKPLAGLSYYLTFFDLNMDVILRAVASDSRTRILSSPVILTTDNKDATIDVSTERYFYKGKRYAGYGNNNNAIYEDDVETKKVGITLTVTPRINEKKFVVMEIKQNIDNVSGVQTINGADWPIVTTRKLEADVAVQSGDTIVLGGLVLNSETKKKSKIPLLGDIPLLGIPFRSSSKDLQRNEVVVFLTPYVLDTPSDIAADAARRKASMDTTGMWQRGWSDSKLADPTKEDLRKARDAERTRRQAEKQRQGAEAAGLKELDPALADFVRGENRKWDKRLEEIDSRVEEGAPKP